MNKIISFPHLGYYSVVFEYFLSKATKCKVIVPPPTTKKTIGLGSKYSPSFVCVPFKYNLGNYIEALSDGATVLIQGGGGCRYGYYAELQEAILKDLGYDFEFYNLLKDNHISLILGYRFCKKMNKRTNPLICLYYLINSLLMLIFIDKIERYIRLNMGFERNKGEFERLEKEYFDSFKGNGIIKNVFLYYKYKKLFKNIEIDKPQDACRVMLLGELYSLIDSNASLGIERKLIKMGTEIHRETDLTYLLITKRFKMGKMLRKARKYNKYNLGADASGSVFFSMEKGKEEFDGIIHLKSFGCMPEISAMSILPHIAEDYNIPILYFSFDDQDNEVGIQTRLEAFYDMMEQKKQMKRELS